MNAITYLLTVKRRSFVDQFSAPKLFVYISTLMCSIKKIIHKMLRVPKFYQTMNYAGKLLNN